MKKQKLVCGAALALSLMLALCACTPMGETAYRVTLKESDAPIATTAEEMLAAIRPTVVDVTCYTESGASAGSGVIISEAVGEGEYFIVTNHHVIEGGTAYYVDVLTIKEDGSESTVLYEADLVGSSKKRDIAVLSVRPGTELSTATFIDDSDRVKVGAEVFGNPLGILGGTVTHGIVSATERDVSIDEIGTMTLMQTDTSINGGNSGGGLFNAQGLLIGIINSGFDSYNGQSVEGLNFAIPANDAKYAASELISTHRETDGIVTQYGYVEGDARMDLSFDLTALYTDATLSARANFLIGGAASTESPLYATWGGNAKVIVSVSVGGKRQDFSAGGSGSYDLMEEANSLIADVVAGDEVTIEYREILGRSTGGFFGSTYYYADSAVKTISVTAEQYIYEP